MVSVHFSGAAMARENELTPFFLTIFPAGRRQDRGAAWGSCKGIVRQGGGGHLAKLTSVRRPKRLIGTSARQRMPGGKNGVSSFFRRRHGPEK
jgi:hypothetical protein